TTGSPTLTVLRCTPPSTRPPDTLTSITVPTADDDWTVDVEALEAADDGGVDCVLVELTFEQPTHPNATVPTVTSVAARRHDAKASMDLLVVGPVRERTRPEGHAPRQSQHRRARTRSLSGRRPRATPQHH